MKVKLSLTLLFLLSAGASQAAVTLLHEYHLGEAGSLLGANNLPQDSVGSSHFTNNSGGSNAVVSTTGVFAPGSTAYLDTSTSAGRISWSGAVFTGLNVVPTDNFAMGVYARASTIHTGNIFSLGGDNGFKVILDAGGWTAGKHGVTNFASTGAAGFTADEWVHLALVRQGGSTIFYVNGTAVGNPYGGAPVHSSGYLAERPGSNPTAAFFKGHIDEARIVSFTENDSIESILGTLQGVPEPSITLLSGLGALALLRRRRA